MARRKVKNGEKSPWGQCLPDQFQTVVAVLASDWCQKTLCFCAQSEARAATTVWNWSGKTLSPGALLAVLYFSACHIFPPRLSLAPTICPWVSEDGVTGDAHITRVLGIGMPISL